MNLIPMIAKELGVEVGEEFGIQEVENCDTEMFRFKYRFMQTELQFKPWDCWIPTTIPISLLTGQAEIKKLPFEPKEGKLYYWVSIVKPPKVEKKYYLRETFDCTNKYCGNCFRTEAEAEKHKYEIYEKLTDRKWEEKCED